MSVTESINAPKNAPGTVPGLATGGTRFTGQELETLPGAKDTLTLLDEAVAATGGQNRAGQRTMAAHVAQALELQRHLLVQAGTGTGKSLGYLVPALARMGESDQPIVVATATLALQAQIVNRDIPRLLQALEPRPEAQAQVALLKGRNNYLCLHKLEGGYPEDEPDALFDMPSSTSRVGEEVVRLREWADRTESLTAPGLRYRSAPPSVWVAAVRWWKSALARWRVAAPLRLTLSLRTMPCWRLTLLKA